MCVSGHTNAREKPVGANSTDDNLYGEQHKASLDWCEHPVQKMKRIVQSTGENQKYTKQKSMDPKRI